MIYLVAAVLVVGAIAALDLLLTFGVVRRLREHTAQLADLLEARGTEGALPAIGETVAPFVALTTDGIEVSGDRLGDGTLVAVFSAGCGPCLAKLPSFVQHAREHAGGRERVLAVVAADDEPSAAAFLAALPDVALTVHEPVGGPIASAFGISGYPTFAVVDAGGVVRNAGFDFSRLAVPA